MMKIYTLFYKDTNLYNKQIFVLPNDETAKKAMKLQLMDPKNSNFINEAKLGNTYLVSLCDFSEEKGIYAEATEDDWEPNTGALTFQGYENRVCNLKDLLNDDNRDLVEPKQDNT